MLIYNRIRSVIDQHDARVHTRTASFASLSVQQAARGRLMNDDCIHHRSGMILTARRIDVLFITSVGRRRSITNTAATFATLLASGNHIVHRCRTPRSDLPRTRTAPLDS